MKTLWAVIAVAVVGGGIYFATANKTVAPADTTQTAGDTTATQNEDGRYKQNFNETTSLSSIVSAGGSYTCTMHSSIGGADTDGTFYIANKKMRGDFSSTIKGMSASIQSHMISDGAYVYSWSDMIAQGFKAKVVTTPANDSSKGFDYNQQFNYDCKAWVSDESKFTVPTTITFNEAK